MAIHDPTALPEDVQTAAEYLREADLAFDREQHDLAMTLYWAMSSASIFRSDSEAQHVYARIGTILVAQGNDDEAYRWLEAAGPAGADMLRAIDARTTDAPVDPDVVPQTPEVLTRYMQAADAANRSGDHSTFDALVSRMMESDALTPGQRSGVCQQMAQSLIDRGLHQQAELWAQEGLAESSGSNADELRALIRSAQAGQASDKDPRYETYGDVLTFAMQDFERKSGDHGKADFEHVATTPSYDAEARGRARYYLGVLAYHARDFDVAREHFEFAADNAAAPEIGYAAEALQWRYQEEG